MAMCLKSAKVSAVRSSRPARATVQARASAQVSSKIAAGLAAAAIVLTPFSSMAAQPSKETLAINPTAEDNVPARELKRNEPREKSPLGLEQRMAEGTLDDNTPNLVEAAKKAASKVSDVVDNATSR